MYTQLERAHQHLRLAMLVIAVLVAATLFGPDHTALGALPKGNIDQCGNGPLSAPTGCDPDSWQNGNLNAQQAHYFEGDSVPYRLRFLNLSTSGTHTVTIEWDTTKSGRHALDYITSVDRTVTSADPCAGVTGCSLSSYDSHAIDPDPNVTGAGVTPISGQFRLYGGTISTVSAYTLSGTYAGDSSTSVTLTFAAAVANPVLAWGGHIATRLDWPGKSAVAISGSPYHMRLLDIDGSGGNQDRSLSNDAVIFPASITIVKNTSSGDATFGFTTTSQTGLATGSPAVDSTFSITTSGKTGSKTYGGLLISSGTATIVIGENDPLPDYALTALVCTDTTDTQAVLATRTATIKLSEGESVTCTFTNTLQRASLTINKVCSPTTDGGTFDLKLDGVTKGDDAACGTGTGALTTTVGSHTVSEAAGTGTDLSNYTSVISGDCDGDGKISLVAGDSKTCTITNTRKPTLTINKVCSPTTDSGTFDLKLDGVTKGDDAACGTGTGAIVTTVGSHTVSEAAGTGTDLDNYTSVIGGDCNSNGTITLAAGDNKTCTITNTRKPTLTINKVCSPTTDNGTFDLKLDGVTKAGDAACGTGTGAIVTTVGSHSVSEAAGTGTNLTNYTAVIGGDCDSSGNITLAAGDNKTCTITNTRKPTLTINKVCDPTGDDGKFDLKLDGATKADDAACGTGTGALTTTVGSHTVSESAGTGTDLSNYTAVISGDCASDGTITLAAGDNKTCTITNTKQLFTIIVLVCRQSDNSLYSSNVTIDGVTKNSLSSIPSGLVGVVTEADLCTKLLGGARFTDKAYGSHSASISVPMTEAAFTP